MIDIDIRLGEFALCFVTIDEPSCSTRIVVEFCSDRISKVNYLIASMERAVEAHSDDSGIQDNTSCSSGTSGAGGARPRRTRAFSGSARRFRNRETHRGRTDEDRTRRQKEFRLRDEDFPSLSATEMSCDEPSPKPIEDHQVREGRLPVRRHSEHNHGEYKRFSRKLLR